MQQHGRPEDTEVKRNLSKRGNVGATQWDKWTREANCADAQRETDRDETRKKHPSVATWQPPGGTGTEVSP